MLIQMLQKGDIEVKTSATADSVNYSMWIDSFKDNQGIRIFPVRAITFRYYLRKYSSNYGGWQYNLIKTQTLDTNVLENIAKTAGLSTRFNYIADAYYWRENTIYIGDAVNALKPSGGYQVYGHPDYQQFELLDLDGNSMSVTCSLTGSYHQDQYFIWATPGDEVRIPADTQATARIIMDYYVELTEE